MSQIGSHEALGRILAIDYGKRRLGLAISDELGLTVRPFATWSRSNRRQESGRLRNLCRAQQIRKIVVGWPLQLSGDAGEMASEAAGFAERIRKDLALPVELVDERLSSWEAEQTLAEAAGERHSSGARKRQTLDDVAAAVILRDYLRRAGTAM